MSGDFWVFKCRNCRHYQVKEVRIDLTKSTFRCFRCRSSYKIKLKNKFGLNLEHKGPYSDSLMASVICKEKNGERGVW